MEQGCSVEITNNLREYCTEQCLAFSKILTPHPPSLLSESVLPPHQRRGRGGYTLAGRWGGGGSIFWKMPDTGVASYSLISLRRRASCNIMHYFNDDSLCYCWMTADIVRSSQLSTCPCQGGRYGPPFPASITETVCSSTLAFGLFGEHYKIGIGRPRHNSSIPMPTYTCKKLHLHCIQYMVLYND
jgi:hypothetical protein